LTVNFTLFGQPFAALNADPQFPQCEAVSFQVTRDTRDEIDALWSALTSDGGEEGRCGWCKDRFGVSWQVIPANLGELLSAPDPEARQYAFRAMMSMGKMVIADFVA
jgi:predicted 3-demethylubiquinone-9 3-methyltransferase (glyoxalase superfamily)